MKALQEYVFSFFWTYVNTPPPPPRHQLDLFTSVCIRSCKNTTSIYSCYRAWEINSSASSSQKLASMNFVCTV